MTAQSFQPCGEARLAHGDFAAGQKAPVASAWSWAASEFVRAATAREISKRILEADCDQAPVDSTTRGTKMRPCAEQTLAVFKCAAFSSAYWLAAAKAVWPACARVSCR